MSRKPKHLIQKFPGFQKIILGSFVTYPNMLESWWWCLEGSEQKCLDFIIRQTIGFRKTWDWIGLSQFTHGIGKTNRGTGLSRSQVVRALKGLELKGFITATHYKNRVNRFSLVYEEEYESADKIEIR